MIFSPAVKKDTAEKLVDERDYFELIRDWDLALPNPNSVILLVLRQLHVPFQVKAAQAVGIIKEGTIVYVEAVAQHKEHKIMYRVLNQWVPYYYFQLIIQ